MSSRGNEVGRSHLSWVQGLGMGLLPYAYSDKVLAHSNLAHTRPAPSACSRLALSQAHSAAMSLESWSLVEGESETLPLAAPPPGPHSPSLFPSSTNLSASPASKQSPGQVGCLPMLIRLCDQMAGEQPMAGRTGLGSPCVQRVLTGEAEDQKVL